MKIIHQKEITDIFQRPKKKEEIIKSKQETFTKIIIDYREKNSFVPTELRKLKQEIEFQELKVGDYMIGNTAIERKTIQDFLNSMINKRLFKQLEELKQFPQHLLIIEGETNGFEKFRINPNAIKGFLLTINLKFKVPTIFTTDAQETAQYLKILANKKEKTVSFQISKRNLTQNERLQFIIEAFPNIGPKKSEELLKQFKTIKNLCNSSEKELESILGKRAKEFKEIIEREFKKD
jgi:Fanconi anemia group M protein